MHRLWPSQSSHVAGQLAWAYTSLHDVFREKCFLWLEGLRNRKPSIPPIFGLVAVKEAVNLARSRRELLRATSMGKSIFQTVRHVSSDDMFSLKWNVMSTGKRPASEWLLRTSELRLPNLLHYNYRSKEWKQHAFGNRQNGLIWDSGEYAVWTTCQWRNHRIVARDRDCRVPCKCRLLPLS